VIAYDRTMSRGDPDIRRLPDGKPAADDDLLGAGLSPEPPDEVTAAFLAGGPDALRVVYKAHAGLVFTYCRRAVGHERAADVTQEVFTDVWRNRHRYDPSQGTLRGWVMGIARNKVLNTLRYEGTRPTLVADDPERPVVIVAPAEAEQLADRMTLAQALGTLPERTRTVIHLSYVDGLSHSEIAQHTGLPLGSVKSDIRRGLERLRAELVGLS
jgi:RNA polymerase sigma factor (sigma-70 family)